MTNTANDLTPAEIVELFDLYEGTGDHSIEGILTDEYGDELDSMVQVWCLEKYGLKLDVKPAYGKLYEWVEKENVPLKGKYRKLCQKQTQAGIDGMNGNGWLVGHSTAVVRCALVESFDDHLYEMLSRYGDSVYVEDEELTTVTGFQYSEAAKDIVIRNAKELVEKEGYKEIFERALVCDEVILGNCQKLLKDFVERHPEHKVALVESLIDWDQVDLYDWLIEEDWYSGLEEAIAAKAKDIYTKADSDWGGEGDEFLKALSPAVRQALAKGGVGSNETPNHTHTQNIQMAFTYDPNFDYYPLFEMCMADGTTEALDDPEDFDEFVQALKDGRYDPETGIKPAVSGGNKYVDAVEEFRGLNVEGRVDILCLLLNRFDIDDPEDFAVAWGKALSKDTSDPDALMQEMDEIWEQPNVALTGHRREAVIKEVNDGIDGHNGNGWLADHQAALSHYFLNGKLSEGVTKIMEEFEQYIYPDAVEGIQITGWQYVECANEVFAERAAQMATQPLPKVLMNCFLGMNTGHMEFDFVKDLGVYLSRHPDKKADAWDALWLLVDEGDWDAERLLYNDCLALFEDEIKANLKRFDDLWSEEEPEGVDYSGFGDKIQLMFNEAGFGRAADVDPEAIEKVKARKASFTPVQVEMSREEYVAAFKAAMAGEPDITGAFNLIVSLELPETSDKKLKLYVLQRLESPTSPVGQKLIAATTGEEVEHLIRGIFGNGKWNNVKLDEEEEEKTAEPQEETDELTDTFNDAMDGCTFDEVFSRANEFEQLIRENIQEIADNFNSENPFAPSGYEEPWLVGLLMKSGALFEGDLDEDEVVEKKQSAPDPQPVTDNIFKGKRVCITGKFDLTRTQLEGLITDVGGIVASGVSKTLDFLIAGEDSGSKLAKAKDLGITILDRDDLTDILGDDLYAVSPVAAKRVIAELLKSLSDIGGDGYFRIDDIEATHITRTSSLEHLEAWLSERIGFDKYLAGYQTWGELKELKIAFTPIDPVNNITVWLFDNECGLATEPEIRTFNTIEDARIFAREANGDWGGHCSVLKVITKKGTEETVQLGYEADFPSWGDGVDEYGPYLVYYKDDVVLIAAVGGEEVLKKMVDDDDFEPIKTAIREGRWPVVKDREFNSKYD